ncbi:MAG: nuclear transport factor 2 family protein [Flavisolibacter sp.]
MKKLLVVFTIFFSFAAHAQSKESIRILAASREVHMAVFRDKDSATLAGFFAGQLSYGHSSGKVENRDEAIHGIIHNTSTYESNVMGPVWHCVSGNTAISRYLYETNEIKKDGTKSPLKIHILMVWSKEKKSWKLIARQAVKIADAKN